MNLDLVLEVLRGSPACDDCLAERAGIPSRHSVNATTRAAVARGFADRQKLNCPRCPAGRRRKWVYSLTGGPPRPADDGTSGQTIVDLDEVSRKERPRVGRPSKRPHRTDPPVTFVPSETWQLEGRSFVRVCEIRPDRGPDGRVLRLQPWRSTPGGESRLHAYGAGPFCRFRIPPGWGGAAGVYVIAEGRDSLYIGETTDLGRRYAQYGRIYARNCFHGGRSQTCRVNTLVLDATSSGRPLSLWFHATEEYDAEERRLRRSLRPPWNRI